MAMVRGRRARFGRLGSGVTLSAGIGRGSVSFGGPANAPVPNIANLSDLTNFAVQWDQWEGETQSLYDSAPYPAAGLLTQDFFQVQVGQGTGFGGGPKTYSDTNMQAAGQLSAGVMFIVTAVEIEFQPTTPTVTAQMPAAFGAQAPAQIINDAYIFRRSGNLQLEILQKNYLREAPLMRLPATADFALNAAVADATTAAASSQSRIAYGTTYGPAYVLTPNNLLIPSNTNFKVTLAWPEGLQAITNPARMFVRLDGIQFRLAQ